MATSEITRNYWIEKAKGWAEAKLSPPQADEFISVMDELRAEISTLQAENDMLKKTASELAKSLITLRTARAEKAEAERDTALARLADLENGRPMATAPRDGTQILVEVICDDFVYLDLVIWRKDRWVGNAADYFELDGRWWPLPGSGA